MCPYVPKRPLYTQNSSKRIDLSYAIRPVCTHDFSNFGRYMVRDILVYIMLNSFLCHPRRPQTIFPCFAGTAISLYTLHVILHGVPWGIWSAGSVVLYLLSFLSLQFHWPVKTSLKFAFFFGRCGGPHFVYGSVGHRPSSIKISSIPMSKTVLVNCCFDVLPIQKYFGQKFRVFNKILIPYHEGLSRKYEFLVFQFQI